MFRAGRWERAFTTQTNGSPLILLYSKTMKNNEVEYILRHETYPPILTVAHSVSCIISVGNSLYVYNRSILHDIIIISEANSDSTSYYNTLY